MKYIYLISIALVVLTGVNLEWEFLSNRNLRLITSWGYLLVSMALLYKNKVAAIPFIALLLVAFCDIFLLNWELEYAKPMYYTVHSLASITFLFIIYLKADKPQLSKYDWLYILTTILILSWVMFTLGRFFAEEIHNQVLHGLFYINGFLSVILSISAFIFSANSTDNYSSYFLLAIVGLTISDLFLFMIYIMNISDLRYIDNLLNIFGCALLVKYMLNSRWTFRENYEIASGEKRKEGKNIGMETIEELKVYS